MSNVNPASITTGRVPHAVEEDIQRTENQQPVRVRCQFCGRAFARQDALRRHYRACSRRGQNNEILPVKRGRPRRACDTCRSQKIQCDGKRPCNRCSSNQAGCSYKSTSPRPLEWILKEIPGQTATSKDGYHGISSTGACLVPFLLNYTNPEFESITYAFAASGALVEPLLEPDDQEPSPNAFAENISREALFYRPGDPILQSRAEDLTTALIQHHSSSPFQIATDLLLIRSTANKLFKPPSLLRYTSTYFDYFHPHIRFIHRPTFDIKTASLPLILAITLAGSAHSPPTDDVLSAHSLFGLAEDYIFTYLRRTCAESNAATEDAVQSIQAAGLISAMLYASNHAPSVRRESHQRIPRLVASLRSLGLMDCRRTQPISQMSWRQFIAEETRIRAVTAVLLSCGINTISFNLVPQITVAEMRGDMPCNDALFEVGTEEEFLELRSSASHRHSQGRSLKEWVARYMCSEWEASSDLLAVLEPKDLLIHIIALHFVIYNARSSMLSKSSRNALVLAMNRWRDLHDIVYSRPGLRNIVGFVKYSIELWWLGYKLLELSSNDYESRYVAGTPTDTLTDLREFLQTYDFYT